MKQILMVLLWYLLTSPLYAQTYEHYEYNRNGVPERVGYTKVQQPIQFAPYVPAVDVNSYREASSTYQRAIMAKQQAYDNNVASLKTLIQSTWNVINNIARSTDKDYQDLAKSAGELLSTYTDEMSGSKYDYSQRNVYDYWYGKIYDIYSTAYKYQNN